MKPSLAIIVPVLNEIRTLPSLLEHLRYWQQQGVEVLLVDGGSQDLTAQTAQALGFNLLNAPAGRALQMNIGADASQADNLLFLHADTRLPQNADKRVLSALTRSPLAWGRFNVKIKGDSPLLPLIASLMNLRSRLSGIATGDQAIFINRKLFNQVGGFPEQPLMEDIEICKRLKQFSPPVCLHQKVITSGRRWDTYGSWSTILLMWQLRWSYWRGTPAEQLAERYR